ncbi:MAG: NAD(P)/FAD-dependent oxidoreductase [Firmicutes bacterium]|nr:NAD(P)/FAD-dependent oxidoreductase [Bacillota bacterium]
MKYDVIVTGGGPSGHFSARLLAEQGFRVSVLEEHPKVGEPVQCAGLISPRTLRLSEVNEEIVINRLTGTRIFSPLGSRLDIITGKVHALAVDRAAFDRGLANQAQNAGAEIRTGIKVTGFEPIGGGVRVYGEEKGKALSLTTRLLVGADGVNSRVAKRAGLINESPRAVMYAADVELKRTDRNLVDVFIGQNLAPGWFGWVIPLDNKICRVGTGVAFSRPGHSPRYYFQNLVERYPELFKDMKIIRYTGGTVPMGLMQKICADRVMLVGDAACQTKPVSGGGIYLALRGAQTCTRVAAEALWEDNLSEKVLSRYQLLWEEEFAEEINCSLSHRESYLKFSDQDIDQLIRFLNKPYWQNIICKYGDIDYTSVLARPLFHAGPWMRKFMKVGLGVVGYGNTIRKGLMGVLS